mmetsp:Transcript_21863/g.43731  ORF Transcript_21863/g.43731 Transcript_21863/m.43731 type:complete len:80 (+) Transcript_21863:3-242(+)
MFPAASSNSVYDTYLPAAFQQLPALPSRPSCYHGPVVASAAGRHQKKYSVFSVGMKYCVRDSSRSKPKYHWTSLKVSSL